MLMPSVFRTNNIFDDFFGAPITSRESRMMKTDIMEKDGGYELTIDMPGVKKENVKAELNYGYLTVSTNSDYTNDEKNEDGRYIRRERYSGSFSRSFYVGSTLKQEDIKAKFEDGTLRLSVPKKEALPETETSRFISIE